MTVAPVQSWRNPFESRVLDTYAQHAYCRHRIDPDAEGEERFVATGRGSDGHVLVVIYTLRGESIRLISVRRATPAENRAYET